jgi:hypothetical protein
MGSEGGDQVSSGCGKIAPRYITSPSVWHDGCYPALGPAQEQVSFIAHVVIGSLRVWEAVNFKEAKQFQCKGN